LRSVGRGGLIRSFAWTSTVQSFARPAITRTAATAGSATVPTTPAVTGMSRMAFGVLHRDATDVALMEEFFHLGHQ